MLVLTGPGQRVRVFEWRLPVSLVHLGLVYIDRKNEEAIAPVRGSMLVENRKHSTWSGQDQHVGSVYVYL